MKCKKLKNCINKSEGISVWCVDNINNTNSQKI